MERGSSLRGEIVRVGVVAFVLAYSWMYADVSVPNERSRVYLAMALVDDHSIAIDGPVRRFGPIADCATYGGRLLTDKAPGSSLLAAVPYAIARLRVPPERVSIERVISLERRVVMIPLSLLGFVLARRWLARRGASRAAIDLTTFAWMLGSTAFHYGSAFYGHQIVAVLFLAALVLLDAKPERPLALHASSFAAGLALGFAGLVEYQAAIGCVALALYALVRRWHAKPSIAWFALGVAPSVLAFAAYHDAAFGGPLELSYHHLVDPSVQALHQEGIGGVAAFDREALKGLLGSLHRGLLTTSPTMLLAIPGLVVMHRSGERALPWTLGLSMLAYLLFAASARAWFAGWSFGPRLLVPMLALGLAPIVEAIDVGRARAFAHALVLALVTFGIAYDQTVHAFFPEPPEDATHPLLDVVAPMARAGRVSPNLATSLVHVAGPSSLVPLGLVLVAVLGGLYATSLRGESTLRKAGVTLGALALTAGAFAAMLRVPPGWDDAQRARFLDVVAIWASREPGGP